MSRRVCLHDRRNGMNICTFTPEAILIQFRRTDFFVDGVPLLVLHTTTDPLLKDCYAILNLSDNKIKPIILLSAEQQTTIWLTLFYQFVVPRLADAAAVFGDCVNKEILASDPFTARIGEESLAERGTSRCELKDERQKSPPTKRQVYGKKGGCSSHHEEGLLKFLHRSETPLFSRDGEGECF